MTTAVAPFDPLGEFAKIERLVSKVYYRFSHLFLNRLELRDFWWQMALDEEGHASILLACKEMIAGDPDQPVEPQLSEEKVAELQVRIGAYLARGTPSIGVEEAFRIAVEIETSEIDLIYGELVRLAGPEMVQLMEGMGSPAAEQKERLKSALRKYCSDPELLRAAARL
jgi:rubrerythrin